MQTYNKLVRDKIPEIIFECGKHCTYHIADDDEYKESLYRKMQEELAEFIDNPCYEEAADIYEVFLSMCRFHELNIPGVMTAACDKAVSRGKFDKRIILRSVQDDPLEHI